MAKRAVKRPRISSWPGGPLPEPRKLTPEQNEAVTQWFSTLPDAEIEYRQSLCLAQMNQLKRRSDFIASDGFENQFVVWKQLAAAKGLKQCQ